MAISNLNSFILSSKGSPKLIHESKVIEDRNSTFVASLYRASSQKQAQSAIDHVKHVVHASNKASHEMAAWRFMTLKSGKDGLGGPEDFELRSGSADDGERYGGSKILNIMQKEGVIDAVVIVSRWFGGTMLGPIRFTHIEDCAREVCRDFKSMEEAVEAVDLLKALDEELKSLRASFANKSGTGQESPSRMQDYETLLKSKDIAKIRRLIVAREKSVSTLRDRISSLDTPQKE
ncbi:ribosomal protein S5 domain 2-like protein [Sistotremastrum niveocremeum HHB9708]|uniref:Ribosomal protein S5 domain 2-like protein n=1 Tax=Sistotremastrum niveocremeum HHB9708 TaxID=1314777 RepID=A0A165A7F2_9AGAM|nr:ribosomal protein S5 domain 2-like protein [Sistotremastrum niveocremeum HHB9708]